MYLFRIIAAIAAGRLVYAKPVAVRQNPEVSTTLTPQVTATSVSETAPSATSPLPGSSTNPCAQVSELYTKNPVLNPKVPAQLAYDCLNDVALDVSAAKIWLETLRPYLEWQSTTAYLKNPPKGYQEPAADIWGGFESIVSGVPSGKFANEYELELALYRLFQTAHDGHFRYLPNMVGGIFGFGRPLSLISYSVDGTQAPRPYVYSDVLSSFVNGTAQPSAVTQIDGKDAVAFLEDWSQNGALQDPDALYNTVFYELAQASLGTAGGGPGTFAGAGRGAYIFPGATTTLTFENGTSTTMDNFARVLLPFQNIKNGADLYKQWINPGAVLPTTNSTKINGDGSVVGPSSSAPAGYPAPVEKQQQNYIAGYYLDNPDYKDVAVLSVASFVGEPDYQDVAYSFLDKASKDGKTKLVIDVSANGGGTIMQGYNLFINLFPDIPPFGGSRYRSHEAFDVIGETISERMYYYPFDYNNPPNYAWQDFAGGIPFNYRSDVNIDNKNFNSWKEKSAQNQFQGDNFTSIIRWNLSDPTIAPANEIQINGYGNRTGLPASRPFKPENIVILYDGYCASTCAIFSEFMTQQAKVKTISIGGRPNKEAMQTVGGVKGVNNYPWSFIQQLADDVYTLAPDQASYLNSTALHPLVDPATNQIPYSRAVGNSGQVNVRDGIRQGDESQTPLQFIYEPSDCRLYYTAEMTVDVTAMWEKVADVAWSGDACVVGGISNGPKSKRNTKEAETIQARALQKAKQRLNKRMQQMTANGVAALEKTLEVYTDINDIQPRHGLMLP